MRMNSEDRKRQEGGGEKGGGRGGGGGGAEGAKVKKERGEGEVLRGVWLRHKSKFECIIHGSLCQNIIYVCCVDSWLVKWEGHEKKERVEEINNWRGFLSILGPGITIIKNKKQNKGRVALDASSFNLLGINYLLFSLFAVFYLRNKQPPCRRSLQSCHGSVQVCKC